ncbi:alpha/beta fold hydrolase [Catenuloplanes sp. NPDC051500]|uniref:alpha/beta fold hydrolase n=1 Tax=Catenuloplanes sp. NPDC051500 TaxID=3363959 RepID=UPI0037B28824
MTFTSEYRSVAGRRLHIRARDEPGTPWVLLHGLAVSHRYLMPTAEALTGPVYAPDLPGFGRSVGPRRSLGPVEHAAVIAEWMDAAGLRGARLIGGSFGCQVAVELALTRPDLVTLLVLIGPTVDPAAPSMTRHVLRLIWDFRREDPRQLPVVVGGAFAAGTRRILGTLRTAVHHPMKDRLPLLTQPVLILRGEHDPIAPERWTTHAARLSGGRAITIPGAAHNVITTAGTRVAALATAFVHDAESVRSDPEIS